MKDFLKGEGYDPKIAGMKNLASTGRLNLVLRQNSSMCHAAAEWKRMHDPDAMKVFPFVRYHCRGDRKTRSSHADLDGKIFHKNDPFLKTHTPPWEFNCRCYLEEITAKEAGKHEDKIQEATPEDQEKVESQSGFSFDPEHFFEEFDLNAIRDASVRGTFREEMEIEYGSQVSLKSNMMLFQKKDFHAFEDEKLKSSLSWKEKSLPSSPGQMNIEDAKQLLAIGKTVSAVTGEKVIFDNECLEHWLLEEGKSEKEINGRLAHLSFALDTVQKPFEVWDQGTQKGFIKAYQRKDTGKIRGVLVFVLQNGKTRTYFLKDLKALDKARKGFSVQVFENKEDGAE